MQTPCDKRVPVALEAHQGGHVAGQGEQRVEESLGREAQEAGAGQFMGQFMFNKDHLGC